MAERDIYYNVKQNLENWRDVGKWWADFGYDQIRSIPRDLFGQAIETFIILRGTKPTKEQILYLENLFKSNPNQPVTGSDAEQFALNRIERERTKKQIKSNCEFTALVAKQTLSIILNREN